MISTYEMIEATINNGKYKTNEEMTNKLNTFLKKKRITEDEYNELAALLGSKE